MLHLCPRTGYKFQTARVRMKASSPLPANPLENIQAGQVTVCAGQIASALSTSNPVWQDFLDYGTVAKELQATQAPSQPRSQPQSPHDAHTAGGQTDTQHEHSEAAGPTADGKTASRGISRHFIGITLMYVNHSTKKELDTTSMFYDWTALHVHLLCMLAEPTSWMHSWCTMMPFNILNSLASA